MHGPINVKSPNNTSKWQMGFNSAFKGLNCATIISRVYMFDNVKIISPLTPDKASGLPCSSTWLRNGTVDDTVNSQQFY